MDLRSNLQKTNHYLRDISALAHRDDERVVNILLLVKLDRLIIGLILRSKLVFLISVRPRHSHSSRVRALKFRLRKQMCGMHSAECVDIDNESNQVP